VVLLIEGTTKSLDKASEDPGERQRLRLPSRCRATRTAAEGKRTMIRLTIMYPDAEDAYFDMDYYLNKHIAMVKELCGDAVKECSVERGLGGGGPGAPAPYRVITRLCVDSMGDSRSSGPARPGLLRPTCRTSPT